MLFHCWGLPLESVVRLLILRNENRSDFISIHFHPDHHMTICVLQKETQFGDGSALKNGLETGWDHSPRCGDFAGMSLLQARGDIRQSSLLACGHSFGSSRMDIRRGGVQRNTEPFASISD